MKNYLAIFGLLLASIGVTGISAAPPTPLCTAVAVNTSEDPTAPNWVMDCIGGCPGEKDCITGHGTDPGYGAYDYCADCQGVEPACCHIIATTGASKMKKKRGVCFPVNAWCKSGPCSFVVANDDPGDETRWVAFCTSTSS